MKRILLLLFLARIILIQVQAQPSDDVIKNIILSKTTDIIPQSIKMSSTGGTAMRQLSGLIHWKRSVTFIGNTDAGRKKYSADVHVDHNNDFIKFTWGDVTYLDIEAPNYAAIENAIRSIPQKFVGGLDGKIRAIKSIDFESNHPEAIVWSGGAQEVALRFKVTFVADGRYDYQERWKSEQVYTVRFFKESQKSDQFKKQLYAINRKKRTDLELIEKLTEEQAKKVRWDSNTEVIPMINWN